MNICYIRNSTIDQKNSVETQRKMVVDYCEFHNIVLDDIIVDEGISGSGEKTYKREGYKRITEMIENGKVGKLIVLSISRWGRNMIETYKSIQLMEKHNTHFISLKENVDTSNPMGRFVFSIFNSLYQLELEQISDRTKDTLRIKKENGKVYGTTPYGFDRVGDDLVENKKEKRLIKKMDTLRDKGFSYGRISYYLTKNRHKTKNGGKWTRQNVYKVMKNHIPN